MEGLLGPTLRGADGVPRRTADVIGGILGGGHEEGAAARTETGTGTRVALFFCDPPGWSTPVTLLLQNPVY